MGWDELFSFLDRVSLELRNLPTSASQVLGFKAWATTLSLNLFPAFWERALLLVHACDLGILLENGWQDLGLLNPVFHLHCPEPSINPASVRIKIKAKSPKALLLKEVLRTG